MLISSCEPGFNHVFLVGILGIRVKIGSHIVYKNATLVYIGCERSKCFDSKRFGSDAY